MQESKGNSYQREPLLEKEINNSSVNSGIIQKEIFIKPNQTFANSNCENKNEEGLTLDSTDTKENKFETENYNSQTGEDVNRSRVLLPNPLPRKRKQSLPKRDQSLNSSKQEKSANIGCQTDETSSDWEEFKNYNRKLKGKSLKDRVEYLGSQLENNIKNEMEEELVKIKQVISTKRLSQPKVYEIHLHQNISQDHDSVADPSRYNSREKEYYSEEGERMFDVSRKSRVSLLDLQREDLQNEYRTCPNSNSARENHPEGIKSSIENTQEPESYVQTGTFKSRNSSNQVSPFRASSREDHYSSSKKRLPPSLLHSSSKSNYRSEARASTYLNKEDEEEAYRTDGKNFPSDSTNQTNPRVEQMNNNYIQGYLSNENPVDIANFSSNPYGQTKKSIEQVQEESDRKMRLQMIDPTQRVSFGSFERETPRLPQVSSASKQNPGQPQSQVSVEGNDNIQVLENYRTNYHPEKAVSRPPRLSAFLAGPTDNTRERNFPSANKTPENVKPNETPSDHKYELRRGQTFEYSPDEVQSNHKENEAPLPETQLQKQNEQLLEQGTSLDTKSRDRRNNSPDSPEEYELFQEMDDPSQVLEKKTYSRFENLQISHIERAKPTEESKSTGSLDYLRDRSQEEGQRNMNPFIKVLNHETMTRSDRSFIENQRDYSVEEHLTAKQVLHDYSASPHSKEIEREKVSTLKSINPRVNDGHLLKLEFDTEEYESNKSIRKSDQSYPQSGQSILHHEGNKRYSHEDDKKDMTYPYYLPRPVGMGGRNKRIPEINTSKINTSNVQDRAYPVHRLDRDHSSTNLQNDRQYFSEVLRKDLLERSPNDPHKNGQSYSTSNNHDENRKQAFLMNNSSSRERLYQKLETVNMRREYVTDRHQSQDFTQKMIDKRRDSSYENRPVEVPTFSGNRHTERSYDISTSKENILLSAPETSRFRVPNNSNVGSVLNTERFKEKYPNTPNPIITPDTSTHFTSNPHYEYEISQSQIKLQSSYKGPSEVERREEHYESTKEKQGLELVNIYRQETDDVLTRRDTRSNGEILKRMVNYQINYEHSKENLNYYNSNIDHENIGYDSKHSSHRCSTFSSKGEHTRSAVSLIHHRNASIEKTDYDFYDALIPEDTKQNDGQYSMRDDDFICDSFEMRRYGLPRAYSSSKLHAKDTMQKPSHRRTTSMKSQIYGNKYESLTKEQIVERELECVDLINQSKFSEALFKLIEIVKLSTLHATNPHSM